MCSSEWVFCACNKRPGTLTNHRASEGSDLYSFQLHFIAVILSLVERVGPCETKNHSIVIFEIIGNTCKQEITSLPLCSCVLLFACLHVVIAVIVHLLMLVYYYYFMLWLLLCWFLVCYYLVTYVGKTYDIGWRKHPAEDRHRRDFKARVIATILG